MKNDFLNALRQAKNGSRSASNLFIFLLPFALWLFAFVKWGFAGFIGGLFIYMAYTRMMPTARRNYQPGSGGYTDSDPSYSWDNDAAGTNIELSYINPATGLPMIGGACGVDVAGNPMGTDLHSPTHDDTSWHHNSFHDHGSGHDFGSSSSGGFDSSFDR